jgi:hypothetical protein
MSGANSKLSYPHHKREIKRHLSKAATLAWYVGNMFALFFRPQNKTQNRTQNKTQNKTPTNSICCDEKNV